MDRTNSFNLDGMNRDDERVGFFPYATGIDREGNECMMVVSHDPSASGCNPFYWDASPYNRCGHEFASQEEAEYNAKWARGSWSVKSVDAANIKIGVIRFTSIKSAVNMGNVS
jgi:hypothetical protein